MTSPTNLTDEGLRERAGQIVEDFYGEPNGGFEDAIFELVQQVRDAAKKEEREMCIEAVDGTRIVAILDQHGVSDEETQIRGEYHNESLDVAITAIRQME